MADDVKQPERPGARFFPFGVGTPTRHDVVGDVDAQRAAVRHETAHRASVLAARSLWPVAGLAIVVAFFFGEQTSDAKALVAGVVVVLSVLGAWALYRLADRHGQAVRRADEQVGVPVPEDLVGDVELAGIPVNTLAGWFGAVEPRDPGEVKTVRRARRRSLEIEGAFVDGLHRVRRCWVLDDLGGWEQAVRGLEPIARRATELDAELTERMAAPPAPSS